MAEPSANLRVRISAELGDIRQGLGLLTRQLREIRGEAARPLPAKNPIADMGISAGQTAQAMRQLPAQFTDIFTSLQGGMPFFTVMVQQGGQIKDSFGGVGPALKGVASGLVSMINPATVLGASLATLGLAAYKGAQESSQFEKALAKTGDSAGVTASQLATMAQQIDANSGSTQASASRALAAVASTGRISSENFAIVAEAADAMQRATGQSIEETVASFVELAKDPVKAIAELNESQHFLTFAVYEQIKALQEQGREHEAQALATRTYAEATIEVARKVVENLGALESAWKYIKIGASEAWDEMMGIGRNLTAAQELQKLIVDNQRDLNSIANANNARIPGSEDAVPKLRADVLARYDRIKALNQQMETERVDAEKRSARQSANELAIENDRLISSQESKAQQRADAIKAINAKIDKGVSDAKLAGELQLAESLEAQRAKAVAAIERKYRDRSSSGTGRASASRAAGLQGYKDELVVEQATIAASTQTLRAQFAARQISAEDYYSRMRELVQEATNAVARSLEGQISLLQKQTTTGKEGIVVGRQLAELEAKLAKVRTEGAAKLDVLTTEEGSAVKTRANVVAAYTAALEASNEALRRHMDARVAQVGMGDREYELQQRINDAYDDRAAKLDQLTLQRNAGQIDERTLEEEKAVLQAKTLDRIMAIRDGYEELKEAEGNWLLGAASAWENYRQQAGNAAQQMGSVVGSVFTGLEDVWVKFTQTGKISFSEMTRSILADLARIQIRQAASGAAGDLLSGLLGAWSGKTAAIGNAAVSSGTSSINNELFQRLKLGTIRNGFSSGGYTGAGGKYEPAGIVHKGEVVWSQADIARAGGVGIVDAMRRGVRAFADGGVVGNAPPITGNSKLSVEVNNYSNNKVQTRENTQMMPDGSEITKLIIDVVSDSLASGGAVAQAGQSRYDWPQRI
jgi:lambda family phage tail tape measure protein